MIDDVGLSALALHINRAAGKIASAVDGDSEDTARAARVFERGFIFLTESEVLEFWDDNHLDVVIGKVEREIMLDSDG